MKQRKGIPRKRSGIRKRDLALLVGCIVAILISIQQEGSVHLQKSFTIPWEEELTEEQIKHNVPKPIVTDLDGDKEMDLLTLTSSSKLCIFSDLRTTWDIGDFYQTLNPRHQTIQAFNIIGVGAGYLTEPPHDKPRASGEATPAPPVNEAKRVKHIVAVTNDYTVTMYNHKLEQLWSIQLPVHPEYDELEFDDYQNFMFIPTHATVMVLPNRICQDDTGMVIVGVDMSIPDFHDDAGDDGNIGATGVHKSYFAMNGKDGTLRWHHNASDFVQNSQEADKMTSQHSYKLTLQHLEHHVGEQDWRYYRRNLIASLPHSYSHHHDVRMQLHRFSPRHLRKSVHLIDPRVGHTKKADEYGELGEKVRNLLQWRKRRPANLPANMLVVHQEKGIEAIHLYTGRTLAQLGPLQEGWLYEDVNDDNIIDAVHAVLGQTQMDVASKRNWEKQTPRCSGVVYSGVPTSQSFYFSKSICIEGGLFHQFEFLKAIMRGDDENGDATIGGFSLPGWGSRDHFDDLLTAAPPLAVHRHIHDGRHHQATYDTDLLFYISSGFVTCINGKTGKARWHTDTDSSFGAHASGSIFRRMFKHLHGNEETALSKEHRMKEKEDEPEYPHLKAYSLYTRTEPDPQEDVVTIRNLYYVYPTQFILAVGTRLLTVLNAGNGNIEHEFSLETTPLAPTMVTDFNNDGTNDIIVLGKGGIFGIAVKARASANAVTATLACVLGLLALLFITHYTSRDAARARAHRSTD